VPRHITAGLPLLTNTMSRMPSPPVSGLASGVARLARVPGDWQGATAGGESASTVGIRTVGGAISLIIKGAEAALRNPTRLFSDRRRALPHG
jgi:hypothetical protein